MWLISHPYHFMAYGKLLFGKHTGKVACGKACGRRRYVNSSELMNSMIDQTIFVVPSL
jgi:hypothetical protein